MLKRNSASSLVCLLVCTASALAQSLAFTSVVTDTPDPYAIPMAVVAADFNGDGKTDVALVTGNYERLLVYLSAGDGTYTGASNLAGCLTKYCGPSSLVAADFNGDGKADILVVDRDTDALIVYLSNGDGTFQSPIGFASNTNSPHSAVATDFNGDGIVDIAFTNSYDNTVAVMLGHGDGTFTAPQIYAVGQNPLGIAVADFNADGHPDLAVANNVDNTLSILLNDGTGNFQTYATLPTGQSPTGITSADFNKDGIADLALTNTTDGTVSVFLGNGDGSFQAPLTITAGNAPTGVKTADFNRDGFPDLVVMNTVDGTISAILGDGTGKFPVQQSFAANTGTDNNPNRIAIGDINADAFPDLVVSDASYGVTSYDFTSLLQVPPSPGTPSSTSVNFNSNLIDSGSTIWFNSALKVAGLTSSPVTITMRNATVAFMANGVNYTVPVPTSEVTFSPGATTASTIYDSATGTWLTTVPLNTKGNAFLSAAALPVVNSLPGAIKHVRWNANFISSTKGVTVEWKWSAAAYSSFTSDYTTVGVKPIDGNKNNPYKNT